ncbi:hypothetical protein, partial [Methylorubrum podarium]|uniref:hypothetical protein n=1 Tax=Methylorubrum podarium TaxID=200476 RepID=UPI001EE34B08
TPMVAAVAATIGVAAISTSPASTAAATATGFLASRDGIDFMLIKLAQMHGQISIFLTTGNIGPADNEFAPRIF